MKPHKRDDRRLLADVQKLMQVDSLHTVFFCALAYKLKDKGEIELANEEAAVLLEKFQETGRVSEDIESFLIDVMTGKIPIFDGKGNQINGAKRGKRPRKGDAD